MAEGHGARRYGNPGPGHAGSFLSASVWGSGLVAQLNSLPLTSFRHRRTGWWAGLVTLVAIGVSVGLIFRMCPRLEAVRSCSGLCLFWVASLFRRAVRHDETDADRRSEGEHARNTGRRDGNSEENHRRASAIALRHGASQRGHGDWRPTLQDVGAEISADGSTSAADLTIKCAADGSRSGLKAGSGFIAAGTRTATGQSSTNSPPPRLMRWRWSLSRVLTALNRWTRFHHKRTSRLSLCHRRRSALRRVPDDFHSIPFHSIPFHSIPFLVRVIAVEDEEFKQVETTAGYAKPDERRMPNRSKPRSSQTHRQKRDIVILTALIPRPARAELLVAAQAKSMRPGSVIIVLRLRRAAIARSRSRTRRSWRREDHGLYEPCAGGRLFALREEHPSPVACSRTKVKP